MRCRYRRFKSAIMIATFLGVSGGGVAAPQGTDVFRRDFSDLSVRIAKRSDGFAVRLVDSLGTARGEVRLTEWVGTISDVRLARGRVLVFGKLSRLSVVYVLDANRASLVDTILCSRFSISPDDRYIVYERALPGNAYDESVVYLVYDLLDTPSGNRVTHELDHIGRAQNSGIPIFPNENRLNRLYRRDATSGSRHELHSPLVWVDPKSFAFVDYSDREVKAVVVSLLRGVSNPEIYSVVLDVDAIVDTNKMDNLKETPASAVFVSEIIPLAVTPISWKLRIEFIDGPYFRQKQMEIYLP